jgi:hypothetical protein
VSGPIPLRIINAPRHGQRTYPGDMWRTPDGWVIIMPNLIPRRDAGGGLMATAERWDVTVTAVVDGETAADAYEGLAARLLDAAIRKRSGLALRLLPLESSQPVRSLDVAAWPRSDAAARLPRREG